MEGGGKKQKKDREGWGRELEATKGEEKQTRGTCSSPELEKWARGLITTIGEGK